MVVAEPTASHSSLETALDPVLERLGVSVHWSTRKSIDLEELFVTHAADPSLIARTWIDLDTPGRARVYLVDRDSERYLVRDVPTRHGLDDVACETVVTIVESAVEALREGGTIGVSRIEARALLVPPPPEPPAPVATRGSVRAAASVQYEASAIGAPRAVAHGPGVSFVVASQRGTWQPAAWITASEHFTVTSDATPIGVSLTTTTLRLVAGVETPVGARWMLRAGLGGGLDETYVVPVVTEGASASAQPHHFGTVAVARAALGADVLVWSRLFLVMGVTCDVDLTKNSYDVLEGGTELTPVVRPWAAEPSVFLGLAWELPPHGTTPRS